MEQLPSQLPILPIRNAVVFPSVSMPLVVGRKRSLNAVEGAEAEHKMLLVIAQKIVTPGDPTPGDLYTVGTLCKIEDSTTTETGSRQIVVTGVARFRISEAIMQDERLMGRGEIVSDIESAEPLKTQALLSGLKAMAKEILELLPGASEPLIRLIERVEDASYLANICASYLNLPIQQKQELLETVDVDRRIEQLLAAMRKEREVLSLQREIRDKMSERLNKAQREALLREQMRTIRAELGEEGIEESADEIEEKLRAAQIPSDVQKPVQEELRRMKALPQASAEYHVVRNYLEWVASMPWSITTEDHLDLARAKRILDEDHYGLEQVKRRIIQFLAVAKLKKDLKGAILCLVGPPGVGKTSLGQSIARALGRKFIRTSLGGVRDESEIRGHRRTYVGAMPGRIIQSIKRVNSRNPVMILDEIDKLRADFHGDPSAAMLEVLDPEQNNHFVDHYLDLPFNLSDVFFVATANVLDTIPPPLRDRMEIIEVNGYTIQEKFHIARNHLLPRELKAHGLTEQDIALPDEVLKQVITHYTREAGVRELQRQIAALLRGAAEKIASLPENEPRTPFAIALGDLPKLLGRIKYHPEDAQRSKKPGVVTGLAWTPHGGDLLFLEATSIPGKGNLILTGQLGDVMKESAQIALTLARSPALLRLTEPFHFERNDIHIHVPAGAIPKDGPSAGVALLAAVLSWVTGVSVDPTLGMTGEITLRGAVLPVGGIKEKILAAHRAGLKHVILPKKNEHDLEEVPVEICKDLQFTLVEDIEEVIAALYPHERATSTAA